MCAQSSTGANYTCTWSDAVTVGEKFIYAAQPALNRIVVIEIVDRLNPVEVRLRFYKSHHQPKNK
jgi:hypothetical protein